MAIIGRIQPLALIPLQWPLQALSGRSPYVSDSMRKQHAAELIDHLTRANRELNDAVLIAEQLDDEHQRNSLRRTLADAIGTVACDAIAPILQLHPDLDPYPVDD